MSDFFLLEPACDAFEFDDAVENFDPNVLPIVGPPGPQGPPGPAGPPGGVTSVDGKQGTVTVLPVGGSTGQVLKKASAANFDVEWDDESGGGGSVTAEDAGSVTPPSPFVLAVAEGGTGATTAAAARSNLGIEDPLEPSAPFAVPAPGSSVSYDLPGITDEHELVRWNFSVSAENSPPADLEWHTYNGYFTIINTDGATSETMSPLFVKPKKVTATAH